ncbi:1-acyl-sn-glycerol-3-phosphate acyltransferase [Burkholderiales bacterium]|nr:1-acyl-sn-glycerol-3-phosphate acyltransferase [Burkholderiales bacterium]
MSTTRARLPDRLLRGALVVLAPLAFAFIVAHILWGMLVALVLFPLLPSGANDALVKFWSRILLVALGIRLELQRDPEAADIDATRGALLLINHVSWVDVFVVAAVTPARFVAKSEIARWPVLGRFAVAVGTVFVERGRRHAVAHVNHTVTARLRAGQSIGIFPEGTTTDGSRLLVFHANLVQAALAAPAPVIPLGLQYRQDGLPSTAAAYIGDTNLGQSLWRILLAPRLTARLHWLPAVPCEGRTRQAIAGRAREAIGAALALPEVTAADESADRQPDRPLATAS